MLAVLATKPETIEEQGGIERHLSGFRIERARIVPVQTTAAGGGVAVLTSPDEAAAIGRLPRWLLKAVHEVQAAGETNVVGAVELSVLAESSDVNRRTNSSFCRSCRGPQHVPILRVLGWSCAACWRAWCNAPMLPCFPN